MNLLVLAIVLGVVASAACAANAAPITSDIPLPNTYDGFVYPSRGAKDLGAGRGGVVIEAFFDLLCSDCKAAWPNIKKLMESYEKNSTTPAPALIVHTFPLPYHHNAFYGNQGAHVVASYASKARGKDVDSPAEAIFKYVDLIFERQTELLDPATLHTTPAEVIQKLGDMASGALSSIFKNADEFVKGMNDPNLNEATRVSWKYAASRYVSGTPTFHVNGVRISAGPDSSLEEWRALLDPLLAAAVNGVDTRGLQAAARVA